MKLEVGMYVRTEYGIAKIVDIDKHTCSIYVDKNLELLIDGTRVAYEFIIGEPSFYLIDLVQVGDYVNGREVAFIDEFGEIAICETDITTKDFEGRYEFKKIKKENIESIVTKEQIEQMQYKVGD